MNWGLAAVPEDEAAGTMLRQSLRDLVEEWSKIFVAEKTALAAGLELFQTFHFITPAWLRDLNAAIASHLGTPSLTPDARHLSEAEWLYTDTRLSKALKGVKDIVEQEFGAGLPGLLPDLF
eukprot:NODE_1092_length_1582_cov_7.786040_g898_i0.p3 GENE.NODE_1092_length_1582_cov_7.786040_g898_i0~~NODE_1092_length_1582_cov_7.786040_g898_i0.p3  ORF type:complete len:121 (-),score=24.29 NODE_1092_length_1582_cov_7.786040_g898_i0:70-432(-)